jgi:hypothetical protein
MCRRRLAARGRVGLALIVPGILVCAATRVSAQSPAPAASPGAAGRSSATTAPTASATYGTPRDPTAAAMAIRWFANEIENVATEKLLTRQDVYPGIRERLARLITELRAIRDPRTMACRWGCPPGDCDPMCWPRPATSPSPRQPPSQLPSPRGPVSLELSIALIGWQVNAIENVALEQLMRTPNGQGYSAIRDRLRQGLSDLKGL